MVAGLAVLRLSPTDFWAMTPRELAAALRGVYGGSANATELSRNDLMRLMRRFPDGQ